MFKNTGKYFRKNTIKVLKRKNKICKENCYPENLLGEIASVC